MIDFGLCRKCEQCGEFDPGQHTESGELGVRPSVKCELNGAVLLMNSDAPKGCPFALEHKLVTQDVPQSFANHMSNCRSVREVDF